MMLTLPIAKKWFDMILAEDPKQRKLDEYREWNEYWGKRFAKVLGFHDMPMMDEFLKRRAQMGKQSDPFQVRYRNGYSGNSPSFKAKVSLSIGKGREEWGAETGKEYYRLHIIDIQDIRNYKIYNIYKT